MPLLRPNTSNELPRELFEHKGPLNEMISIAATASEKRSFGSTRTVATARRQLQHLCPGYSPSQDHPEDVLCASGESNGQPKYRACNRCIAGQFSASGVFVGELVPVNMLFSQQLNANS